MLGIYLVVGVINILAIINDYNIPNTPELKDIRVRRSAQLEPYATGDKGHNSKLHIKSILSGEYFKERVKRDYPVYPQTGYVKQVNTSWNNGGSYPGSYNGNMNTSGSNGYNAASGNNPTGVYYNGYSGVPYYPQYRNNTYTGYRYPIYAPYPNNTYAGYSVYYPVYTQYPNNTYPGYGVNTVNNPYPVYNATASHQPSYNSNRSNNLYPGYGQNPGSTPYPGHSSNSNYNANTYSPYSPEYPTAGYSTPVVTSTTPRIDSACLICNIGCPQFMKRMGFLCVKEDEDYD